MSVKTIFLYFSRILFFSGILFLSLHARTQESESKTENKTPATEDSRTIDSIEKNPDKTKNTQATKNRQVAQAETNNNKVKTDKGTKEEKKKQNPIPEKNPLNEKLIEMNGKLIANKKKNVEKTDSRQNTDKTKSDTDKTKNTQDEKRTLTAEKNNQTNKTEAKKETGKTNQTKNKTPEKNQTQTTQKNQTQENSETKKKSESKKTSDEKVKDKTDKTKSDTDKTKNTQDEKRTPTTEKNNQTNKTEVKKETKETGKTNQTKNKTPEKNQTQTTQKNQTQENSETKKKSEPKKTSDEKVKDKTDKTKSDTDKTKNTQNEKKTQTTEKNNQTNKTEVKKETGKTNQTKTKTPEKNQTQTTQENKTQEKNETKKTQENSETKKKTEPGKQKTTLEYEAQQIKGNIKTEKPEPKKQEVQTQNEKQDKEEETPVVVGHRRGQKRSLSGSPVPVDVIDSSNLITFGNTVDITDQLNTLVPSYMASPATVKNSAFVRPTSLRGMAGDQTLVLLNGKRRHRSALVQEFGPLTNRGSQGIDIAMIPTIALKNVEVLRGGASAQYGSDAMAGVMNFNLREAPDKATIQATYGHFFEGERSWRVGANLGLSLLENHGFANLSFDTNQAQGHSRGEQDIRASRLIGLRHREKTGIGNDAIFDDSPLVNSWGRPEKASTRFMLNSGLQLSPDMKVYLFGNYAMTNDRIRLLYRDPKDPTFMGNSRWADNLNEIRKTGFTPFLNGEQEDFSAVLGLKGELCENTNYDFSTGFGSNTLHQRLKNSLNPDSQLLYGAAQRDFNLGSYKQQEQSFNADFSTSLNKETKTNISYGLEYREELFGQYAGSFGSYVGRGPGGMIGISQLEAGEYTRNNYSAYIDMEHTFRKSMFVQYSLRYDRFSDFGQTTNNKIASLIKLTPNLSLRGSFSTNFRAPTLGQSNLMSTIADESLSFLKNNHYSHTQPNTINIPASGHDVRHFGGNSLKEERSTDISLGFISKVIGNSHVSVDGYSVTVNDRIYKNTIRHDAHENNISFFANALDLRHQGFDLVWATDLSKNISFADIFLDIAYNYNVIDIIDNKFIGGRKVLTEEQVEDFENNYPKHNFIITANAKIKKWGFMTRARYIGDHYGEVGTLERKNDSQLSQPINSVVYIDLELSYKPTKDFTFVLGGANIFDEYPQRMTRPYANLMDYGMPYSRQTVANYEGGSWYLRMLYDF